MKLTLEQVRHVAKLARLHLSSDEEERYAAQLSSILGYIEQLQKLDTGDVPPMTHATHEPVLFRDDVPRPSLPPETAVQNAPEKLGTSVAVPKIIE